MTAPYSAMLRKAIHDGASAKSWAIVATSLDRCDDPEKLVQLIAFAEKYVIAWPEKLRVAPANWWIDLVEGREQPRWRLARALDLGRDKSTLPSGFDVAAALAEHA